ncbi:MAG: hypothetical protein ACOYLC_14520, partial [Armatimonadaceae bacterium]
LDVREVVNPYVEILHPPSRHHPLQQRNHVREGAAALPYAENSSSVHNNPTFITIKRDNA